MHKALESLYGPAEAKAIVRLLMEERYGLSMTDILLGRMPADWDPALFARLQAGEPVQYVLGHTTFCGLRVNTDPRALIPRPETEGLVALARQLYPTPTHILDVCTGSGCIALALKHMWPTAHVEAWDISPDALDLARENFALHGLDITTRQINLLNKDEWPSIRKSAPKGGDASGAEEIIISNPPYVLQAESAAMQPNVLCHEPHLALFVPDDDPLLFYRALASLARQRLKPGGSLIVECNTAFVPHVVALFSAHGLVNATTHDDCFLRPRFVAAQQPAHPSPSHL